MSMILSIFFIIQFIYAEEHSMLISYNEEEYEEVFEPLCDINFDGEEDCDKFFSFAATNWRSKDYRGCIDQYKTALYCDCVEGNQDNIYKYLGRSFSEMNILDSAYWAFEQGLRYEPDNEVLLELAAWNAGKLKKTEDQFYYLDRLLEINPNNVKALERMSDTFKKNEMFEEQINILNLWLSIDKGNKKAIAEKKIAFSNIGMDQTQVDKERWELDKTNVQFGLDYVDGLSENEEYDKGIEICNELLVYEPGNKRLLKSLSNLHINIYEENKALEYLEKLADLDKNNPEIMIEISEICINLSLFKKAYNWVNKAIETGKILGKGFYQRAEVLVATVEYNRSDEIDFCDRLVYDIANQDYDNAYKNGNLNAKIFMSQLEDFISTKGDWFLNADGAIKISPSDEKCSNLKQSDCYSWIKRSIKTKDN
tara:strand:- start:190 stop:1464 length:1275 start_codon:yes stop_codon:yes gene_type:complete